MFRADSDADTLVVQINIRNTTGRIRNIPTRSTENSTTGKKPVVRRSIGQLDPRESQRKRPVSIRFEDDTQRRKNPLLPEIPRVKSSRVGVSLIAA